VRNSYCILEFSKENNLKTRFRNFEIKNFSTDFYFWQILCSRKSGCSIFKGINHTMHSICKCLKKSLPANLLGYQITRNTDLIEYLVRSAIQRCFCHSLLDGFWIFFSCNVLPRSHLLIYRFLTNFISQNKRKSIFEKVGSPPFILRHFSKPYSEKVKQSSTTLLKRDIDY